MRNFFVAIAMLILYGCVTAPETGIKKLQKISSDKLRIVGYVDPETEEQIVNSIDDNIKTIVITSGGGEVKANIRLANLIRERGIRLEVVDFCMSSCFNYLFLAAPEKTIHENSVLGYHGSTENSIPSLIKLFAFEEEIAQERQLLEELELNPELYNKLALVAEQLAKIEGNFDMLMIDKRFFDENNIRLDNPWFPKSQAELDDVATMIRQKYNKSLHMTGRFTLPM